MTANNEMMIEVSSTNDIVSPNVEQTIEVLKKFLQLKEKALDKDDVVVIEGKKYIKRSGWRKISLAFNVKTEILDIQRERDGDVYIVRARARATAPNGRFADEIAVCDSTEFQKGKLKATLHNIEAKAITRAINRAISDLVGGGEVSAEEVNADEQETQEKPKPEQFPATQKQIDLIRNLSQKAGINVEIANLSKDDASRMIDDLYKKIKENEGAKA